MGTLCFVLGLLIGHRLMTDGGEHPVTGLLARSMSPFVKWKYIFAGFLFHEAKTT